MGDRLKSGQEVWYLHSRINRPLRATFVKHCKSQGHEACKIRREGQHGGVIFLADKVFPTKESALRAYLNNLRPHLIHLDTQIGELNSERDELLMDKAAVHCELRLLQEGNVDEIRKH